MRVAGPLRVPRGCRARQRALVVVWWGGYSEEDPTGQESMASGAATWAEADGREGACRGPGLR